eukprot:TRINITY_DN2731_c0_g1_i5.p1 TRINITY_DN2731_c0_g1~~TRINITY_DN2731_c0_g1_i5.p1  ORF type:complete len:381 (+),score=77.56 TRINITY_DN2731_c0_g1_i5:282-1424(+)
MQVEPSKRKSLSCSSSCFHNHEQEQATVNSLSRSLGVIDIEETAKEMHGLHRHRHRHKHASNNSINSSDYNGKIASGSELLPIDADFEVKIIRRRRRKTQSTQIESTPYNKIHNYNTYHNLHEATSTPSSSLPSSLSNNTQLHNSNPTPLDIPRSTSLPPCYHSTLHDSLPHTKSTEDQFVALCVCQQSTLYPFCDDTHKKFNQQTNSSISPIYAKVTITDQSTPTQTPQISPAITTNSNNSTPSPNQIDHSTEPQTQTQVGTPLTHTQTITTPPKSIRPYITPGTIKDHRLQKNIFEWEEISLHNTLDDCWMVFNGNVYDVSKYVNFHPGGKRALQKFAGKDGSENIEFHSEDMLRILDSTYFIGKLKREEEPSRCIIS